MRRSHLSVDEDLGKFFLRLPDEVRICGERGIIRRESGISNIIGVRGQSKTAWHSFPAWECALRYFLKDNLTVMASQEINPKLGRIGMRRVRKNAAVACS